VRRQIAGLALLFLTAHLLYLPPTLEDIDSINFALGVREFDVARHQPHPPGYPVFVALARLSTALFEGVGMAGAAPRGLAVWSAVAGAALVPILYLLFRTLVNDSRVASWATAVTVCSPLYWFTALRPLSDMTGLAFAAAAQALLIGSLPRGEPAGDSRWSRPHEWPAGAQLMVAGALCGIAAGVRSQTVILTGPLFLAALVWPGTVTFRYRTAALAAALIAATGWGVPLIWASGGLGDYLAALGTQAGEDFSGVVMLWKTPEPRLALNALLHSFIWPWARVELGIVVVALAAFGLVRGAWHLPRAVALLVLAFAPYAVFHLLFQETVTVRYALPLVIPVGFLAVYAVAGAGRLPLTVAGAALVFTSLAMSLPATRAYAREGSPAFRVFQGALLNISPQVIGFHFVMGRVEEWEHDSHRARVLQARAGREWLALVEHWRNGPDSTVHFLADPRRTDLALFDPQARTLTASARWPFREEAFVAGARPGGADLYTMSAPGWMLDRGWALTAEIAGVTANARLGPHIEPSVAWVRARQTGDTLILGGRYLGGEGAPPARLTLTTADGQVMAALDVSPGPFFETIVLPAGALDGHGYVPLRVSAAGAHGATPASPLALEQFDIQPEGQILLGLLAGWQEPEYNPATGRAWRWMSDRAELWVRPVDRDVTVTLDGESPAAYFDRAPDVRVMAGDTELARFSPSTDFVQRITIPAAVLDAAEGRVTLESDLSFSPAERSGAADQRRLALRIYSVRAE